MREMNYAADTQQEDVAAIARRFLDRVSKDGVERIQQR
jgi:glycine betaine/choline ABC-type transport system substrate-binding protein